MHEVQKFDAQAESQKDTRQLRKEERCLVKWMRCICDQDLEQTIKTSSSQMHQFGLGVSVVLHVLCEGHKDGLDEVVR